MLAASLYFSDGSDYSVLLREAHKYTELLWVFLTSLVSGCLLYRLGSITSQQGVNTIRTSSRDDIIS